MSTVIVHGTFDREGTWWRVPGNGGFIDAVAQGMRDVDMTPDIWTIGGAHVSRFEVLQPKSQWNAWTGRTPAPFDQTNGCFRWTGGDYHGMGRIDGGEELARYLNTLASLRPDEPINLIAHSHGCNVVKVATARIHARVRLRAIAFLAGPHFALAGKKSLPYRLNPQSFRPDLRAVLNVFDAGDGVQQGLADLIGDIGLPPGLPAASWLGFQGTPVVDAYRVDPDPASRHLYDDVQVSQAAGRGFLSSIQRHSLAHGAVIGRLVGVWIGAWPNAGGHECCQALGIRTV